MRDGNKDYHLGVGRMKDVTPDELFARLKLATSTTNITDLAAWLDWPVSRVRKAKKCGVIPVEWLGMLSRKKSPYAPGWVLTGEGSPFSGLPEAESEMLQ